LCAVGVLAGSRGQAQFQQFSSGSTGADGALNITAPGVTYLDPKAMSINPKGDNIFHFTTITIARGSILKISELKVHGPVFFLAQGDVVISGAIDVRGDNSPGPTVTATEQIPAFAGSGGYSGGLGGVFGDQSHQALPGNGLGGGAAGNVDGPRAVGGAFTANRFLVPLIGGSGAGGTNDNGLFGAQGGAGGGALLIASSTKIVLDGGGWADPAQTMLNGGVYARGGWGGTRGCGGAGGAVRLVANSIIVTGSSWAVDTDTPNGVLCSVAAQGGFYRIEANTTNFTPGGYSSTSYATSLPFALNLPTAPPAVITVSSVGGVAINANPFSFPDATINSTGPVPVVINASNLPANATVTLYLFSDSGPNQAIPVTLSGNSTSSSATVQVTFPPTGTRGFVKAKW
jgi:hypothetical protein